jgi:NAD(P)-dependent dehydrogenase (short-subunit alcohol dehydrogenase family)
VTQAYWDERHGRSTSGPSFFAIQAVGAGMSGWAAAPIVNFGSTGWQTKGSEYPCYAIAKSSVNGLTRGIAVRPRQGSHPHQHGLAGWVMTERQMRKWLTPEGEAAIARNQCLPDRLQPEDVARWCCSSPRTTRRCARRRSSRWTRVELMPTRGR